MEELYQNMMIDGPDLSMRIKAAEREKMREESDDNFNVSYGFNKAKNLDIQKFTAK